MHRQICKVCKEQVAPTQFGFWDIFYRLSDVQQSALFNVYSEHIFRQVIFKVKVEVVLRGNNKIYKIRCVDDAVIFADSMEGVAKVMDNLIWEKEKLWSSAKTTNKLPTKGK